MLDLKFLCDNVEAVRANCAARGVEVDLDELVRLRDRRGELIRVEEDTRAAQKEVSSQIPAASPDERPPLIAEGKRLREAVGAAERERKEVEDALAAIQARVPNMTHPDSPVGGEEDAKTVRTWGTPRAFDFEPLDHVAIAEKHDLIDFEAGARVAGSGFYFLKNEAALLELALVQYAVSKAVAAGFVPHVTPDLARNEILAGIGFNPRGDETQIYSVDGTDLSLVATAEITLGGALSGSVLDPKTLPRKVCGVSHCFRTEAGAHGRAGRGIYRVHQFTKVEMFAFAGPDPADSAAMLDEIVAVEEAVFQGLGIPYRVVDIATGDLGAPAYRKFDLEAWMPGRGVDEAGKPVGEWGEVTSASNCTTYQARRLDIRVGKADGKGTDLAQTLNGTAVAVSRALIALLENHQNADRSVTIPEPLRPFVGKDAIGG